MLRREEKRELEGVEFRGIWKKKRKEGWKNRERGKLEGGCIQKDGKRDRWSTGNGTAPEQAWIYESLIRNKV